MGFDLKTVELSDVASINPRRRVQKGALAPFVEMAALPINGRDIPASSLQTRIAKGSGSHFQNGDTLLARITPCLENGKTAQVSGLPDGTVGEGSTEFIVLCGIDPADNDFIYYVCRSPDFRDFAIARMEGTSGRQRVAWRSIAGYQMILPPAVVRRESAALLAALDDRIQSLREINDTLEAIAQALFKSWFVDFDPVRAKAGGREPEGMDAATSALFPSEFEDSELGPIPKGWMIRTVADIATVTRGRSYKSSDLQESSDALVTLKSFHRGGGFRRDGFKPYTGPFKENQVTRVGDCIVAYTDVTQQAELIGRSAIVEASPYHDRLIASLDVGIVRPLQPPISPELLRRLLSGDRYVAHVKGFVTGTTVLHLAKDGLPSYTFALPQDELLEEWCEHAQLLADRRAVNSAMLESLSELRDTLLPRLISGRLQPSEAASECVEA